MGPVANNQQGALYAEVLVAVAILALMLVPATDAIYSGLRSTEHLAEATTAHFRLVTRMEELHAETFASLQAAAAASGSPTTATTYSDPTGPLRRLVYLVNYDMDNDDGDGKPFTGGEPDVMWARVEIEGTNLGLESIIAP